MAKMVKRLIGDTLKITWINSGIAPGIIYAAVYNGSETLVSSVTMTASGNGHYYAMHTIPNTPGFYVAETVATVTGNPYKDRIKFKATQGEVD